MHQLTPRADEPIEALGFTSQALAHRSASINFDALAPRRGVESLYQPGPPETPALTFGILPLTDAAPIVVAHAKGFFTRYGIESTVKRYLSWTAIRDAVNLGDVHGAHMMFGMPVAAAVGKLGTNQKPLIIPWVLNRNGQAITLANKHRSRFSGSSTDLKSYAKETAAKGRPMVFGITLQPGTHAMWLRYWLAVGGIDPDKDVALITVPPPQMAENMRAERMDGFCVGDPWNQRAEDANLGFTAALSEQVWPDHPEKVLAFTEEFGESNPQTVKAVLQALDEASAWCDAPDNNAELGTLLSAPEYLNCPSELIQKRLGSSRGINFRERKANYPQIKHAVWWLSQLRRWSLLVTQPDYLGIASRVIRTEFYDAAMQELGNSRTVPDFSPEALSDGTIFDPKEPEAYAKRFPITHCR